MSARKAQVISFEDLFDPRMYFVPSAMFKEDTHTELDFKCDMCGATPTTLTPPRSAYHYDAPERALALTFEFRLLSLDCIGFQSFVRIGEIECERAEVDVLLSEGDPNRWMYLCSGCREDHREYWDSMWQEYYSMVL